jgi:hypothetical protein
MAQNKVIVLVANYGFISYFAGQVLALPNILLPMSDISMA